MKQNILIGLLAIGLALPAIPVSAGPLPDASAKKVTGKITVTVEYPDIYPNGCSLNVQPQEVLINGTAMRWRSTPGLQPPAIIDTGNPWTKGFRFEYQQKLKPLNSMGISQTIAIRATTTCPGYSWSPATNQTVTLSPANRYSAKVKFIYKQAISVPKPKIQPGFPAPNVKR